nr:hypothetical protein [Tanacetum cinerariifolium]
MMNSLCCLDKSRDGSAFLKDEAGVPVSGVSLEIDHTENPHMRPKFIAIRMSIVSGYIKTLMIKPPVRDSIGCTDMIIMFAFNPQ